jgi:hypothetical protein
LPKFVTSHLSNHELKKLLKPLQPLLFNWRFLVLSIIRACQQIEGHLW